MSARCPRYAKADIRLAGLEKFVASFENFQDQASVEGRTRSPVGTNNGKLEALEVGNTTTPLTMNDLFRKSSWSISDMLRTI
jgi:hypothetical protein